MKRQSRVLKALEDLCETIKPEAVEQFFPIGYTAEQVALTCGVSRSNTCSELNKLFQERAVVKTIGRPTYYLAASWIKANFPNLNDNLPELIRHHWELTNKAQRLRSEAMTTETASTKLDKNTLEDCKGAFAKLIGAEGSLKTAIEQAEASVLYPPRGLDSLLVGPTGVGKTMFAEYMFNLALSIGKVPSDAKLVVFNCADYVHNPQLLMSHLFGHVRGAFTGADKDKTGLVEQANGGMLLLDEIHRLPPEGQEMLFYILDKGEFRRLGETEVKRNVSFMLVGATTEEPEAVLLKTFLRRIPMVIHLPELSARPLAERFALIKFLLSRESIHISADIVLEREALRCLLLYNCPGNIGQLRNDLQMICAKAFLGYVRHKNHVLIEHKALPQKITNSIPLDAQRQLEVGHILAQIGKELVIKRENHDNWLYDKDERLLPVDFYQELSERINFLERQGLDQHEVMSCIELDIDRYFRQLSPNNSELPENHLKDVLPNALICILDQAIEEAQHILGKPINRNLYHALAMHIAAFLDRVKNGQPVVNPNLTYIIQNYPLEYSAAQKIAVSMGEYAGINIPDEEVGFIALILAKLEESTYADTRHVGIMVIAHGNSTASSMVDFANRLLCVSHGRAIDMPLEASVGSIIDKAEVVAREIDQGKGIVLMVDMGSLCTIGHEISKRTGIPVVTVDRVTTIMVLQALHKASLPNTEMNDIYLALMKFLNTGKIVVGENTPG